MRIPEDMFSIRFKILICLPAFLLRSPFSLSHSPVFFEFKIGEAVIYVSLKIVDDAFMSPLASASRLLAVCRLQNCISSWDLNRSGSFD